MLSFIEKNLSLPRAAVVLLVLSLASLLFVLIMQYGFGFNPCILCLWQRVPYAVTAVMAAALVVQPRLGRPYGQLSIYALAGIAFVYLAGAGLAFFHTGVERHWWVGTSSCSTHPLAGGSAADLREALLHTVTARCDEISWSLFGLSMTNYNLLWSLGLAVVATLAAAVQSQKTSRR
jgi:disulfide bond formation protein DsbB